MCGGGGGVCVWVCGCVGVCVGVWVCGWVKVVSYRGELDVNLPVQRKSLDLINIFILHGRVCVRVGVCVCVCVCVWVCGCVGVCVGVWVRGWVKVVSYRGELDVNLPVQRKSLDLINISILHVYFWCQESFSF